MEIEDKECNQSTLIEKMMISKTIMNKMILRNKMILKDNTISLKIMVKSNQFFYFKVMLKLKISPGQFSMKDGKIYLFVKSFYIVRPLSETKKRKNICLILKGKFGLICLHLDWIR